MANKNKTNKQTKQTTLELKGWLDSSLDYNSPAESPAVADEKIQSHHHSLSVPNEHENNDKS